ncbi:tyrosine-protein phosphatase [Actinokineospora auranticolor]|uniref:Protein-tyrosine phosphatase n=1 Tax=Actinokineospora auranticolor TaxID=155976 RepID=A0A2S6GV83_9PSEU|nr:tyrosine-protein phosphatase [Actinokineospora auranticolor]PPK69155.1 protein-tyrosine phosphatase [Actinokineospora auranticolor]
MRRHLDFDRLHNFRDLGGYPTADGGAVRWGLLYRSDSLGKLAGTDLDRFRELDVRTVIDLRHDYEIAARGRVPALPGLVYHHLPIEHRAFDQTGLDSAVDPGRYLADRYLEYAEDGVVELRAALTALAEPGTAVFHCASGKDRTGVLAALVLALVGVSESDVVADFALTGLATERLVADWRAENEGRPPAWHWYGHAPAETMRLFLADLLAEHGSVADYVLGPVGLAPSVVDRLRTRLTLSPPA